MLPRLLWSSAIAVAFCLLWTAGASAENVRIGVLATLDGAFAPFGQEARRGVELAVVEFGGVAGGRPIDLEYASTNGDQATVIERARKLIVAPRIVIPEETTGIDEVMELYVRGHITSFEDYLTSRKKASS